jgi:hypothetical protein
MVINRILTITALAILAGGLASADMFVTTDATTVGPTLTDFDWSLVFGATATPAGFHLVGATLEVSDTVTDPTLTLTNTSSSSQTFQFVATSEADINTNTVDGTLVGTSTAPTAILTTGLVTFTVGETVTYSPISLLETLGPTAVTDATGYLAGVTLTGDTSSGTSFKGGGGNIKVDQVQDATINGELVFDFAKNSGTIPEPTSIILFGTVLLGLGWRLRRRRAN